MTERTLFHIFVKSSAVEVRLALPGREATSTGAPNLT
jgi:hypothetical protein